MSQEGEEEKKAEAEPKHTEEYLEQPMPRSALPEAVYLVPH